MRIGASVPEVDPDLLRVLDEASAKQLVALIAEWAHAPDDRRWIARALRIDLALLTERPELVVPCVVRRCAFAGDEGAFYRERPEVELATLRARMEDWTAQWRGGPWLRAMRPPRVPIDSAAIEEYRTSVRGRLWADDDRIGVAGDHGSVAWERATGRRIAATPTAAPPAEAWKLGYPGNTWGRLVIERDGTRIDLELGESEIARGVHSLDNRHVLVRGDDVDMDDFYFVIDLAAPRIAWRKRGACHAVAAVDGWRTMVAHETGIDFVTTGGGETLASFGCPEVGHELVVLPNDDIAMRTGDVIRVWSVGQALNQAQVTHPSTNSWTYATFSPDNTRLVTGQILCDVATGRAIRALDCNGPAGWLEGGPPRNCQRLCNGVFAEILPFGLTVWDARDGRQLLNDRERRARYSAAVAFDPTGRYHAIWEERGQLTVYRLAQGTVIRELAQPSSERFDRVLRFSDDGELLAWKIDDAIWWIRIEDERPPGRLPLDEPPWESEPLELGVEDGVLVVDNAVLPCDDTRVIVSPDGRHFAGLHSHVQLVTP